jgi:hypothetical protein
VFDWGGGGVEGFRDGFSYFRSGGVDKYLEGGGVLLLALAGTWWQHPERPRKESVPGRIFYLHIQ